MTHIKHHKEIASLLNERAKLLRKYHAIRKMEKFTIKLDSEQKPLTAEEAVVLSAQQELRNSSVFWASPSTHRSHGRRKRVKLKGSDTLKQVFLRHMLEEVAALDERLFELGFRFEEEPSDAP